MKVSTFYRWIISIKVNFWYVKCTIVIDQINGVTGCHPFLQEIYDINVQPILYKDFKI